MPLSDDPAAEAADDPLAGLRREVGTFRQGESRRVFPMRVCVGDPGEERRQAEVGWPVPGDYDSGLRLDVWCSLLEAWSALRPRAASAWLVRPGTLEPHDVDAQWHAAALHAFGVLATDLGGFYVLTREGWRNHVTGASRSWRRLRL